MYKYKTVSTGKKINKRIQKQDLRKHSHTRAVKTRKKRRDCVEEKQMQDRRECTKQARKTEKHKI